MNRLALYGIAAAVLLTLVAGSIYGYGRSRYKAGEAAAWAEAAKSIDKANAEVKAKDAKYRTATADLQAQLSDALNRPALIRTVIEPRTLVKEVTREGPTCPDFAPAFSVQWNTITAGDGGAPAAPVVPGAASPEELSASSLVRRSDF